VPELFQGSKMMREGFARPFGWRGMVVDLEGALVLPVLGAGWRREEASRFEVEAIWTSKF
jgi:hypothetical protein